MWKSPIAVAAGANDKTQVFLQDSARTYPKLSEIWLEYLITWLSVGFDVFALPIILSYWQRLG